MIIINFVYYIALSYIVYIAITDYANSISTNTGAYGQRLGQFWQHNTASGFCLLE